MKEQASMHYGNLLEKDPYVKRRFEGYLSLISKKLKSGCKILDFGGYNGDFYQFLKDKGSLPDNVVYEIIDFDQAAIEIAKSKGISARVFDFNKDNLENFLGEKKYDLIICAEVLEHLLDPAKQLQILGKMLKNDGFFLISLPNENTIFHRAYCLLGFGPDQYVFELFKHLHFPTIKQSRNFVSKFFSIKKEIYYINPGGKGSRMASASMILKIFPDSFWQLLANVSPGLFARGGGFLGN